MHCFPLCKGRYTPKLKCFFPAGREAARKPNNQIGKKWSKVEIQAQTHLKSQFLLAYLVATIFSLSESMYCTDSSIEKKNHTASRLNIT